jgi:hypothetical protein
MAFLAFPNPQKIRKKQLKSASSGCCILTVQKTSSPLSRSLIYDEFGPFLLPFEPHSDDSFSLRLDLLPGWLERSEGGGQTLSMEFCQGISRHLCKGAVQFLAGFGAGSPSLPFRC